MIIGLRFSMIVMPRVEMNWIINHNPIAIGLDCMPIVAFAANLKYELFDADCNKFLLVVSLVSPNFTLKRAHPMGSQARPPDKEFVKAFMPLLRVERREVNGMNGKRFGVAHNVFQCPKGNLCCAKDGERGEYASQQTAGYRNAYRHLLKCYAGSDSDFLLQQYLSKTTSTQLAITSHLSHTSSTRNVVNTREKAMFDVIRFIVENLTRLSIIETKSFRNIYKYQ